MNNNYFLHIRKMSVVNLNARANAYVLGVPALTGFVGYGHVLARHFQEKSEFKKQVKVTGVAPMLRSLEIKQSHPKYANYLSSADLKKPASTIDEKIAHLSCDLFIRLEITDQQLAEEIVCPYITGEYFERYVMSLPLCGGLVQSFDPQIKWLVHEGGFRESLLPLPSNSFFLEDVCDLLAELTKEKNHRDNLDKCLELIRFKKKNKNIEALKKQNQNKDDENTKKQKHYYVSIAIGFHGLEDKPKNRKAARHAQHLYAEPVMGIARVRTVGSVRKAMNEDKERPPIFWHYQNDLNNRLFIVRAK